MDFRFPPPMRTSVLLPQPEASTIPKPNSVLPTIVDSHKNLLPVYMLFNGSIKPKYDISAKPTIATPMAKNHCFKRPQLDIIKISETAPMLQNPVFCITAPSKKVIAKVASKTDLLSEEISTASIIKSLY